MSFVFLQTKRTRFLLCSLYTYVFCLLFFFRPKGPGFCFVLYIHMSFVLCFSSDQKDQVSALFSIYICLLSCVFLQTKRTRFLLCSLYTYAFCLVFFFRPK